MKLTQGCFSFLPDLTDEQITKQIQYAINKSWAISIEYMMIRTHVTTTEMWGLPLFDIKDPAAILFEINMCKKAKPNYYVRLLLSITLVVLSHVYSFIVNRPAYEPGFRLVRQEVAGRKLVYTIEAYAPSAKPEGERY